MFRSSNVEVNEKAEAATYAAGAPSDEESGSMTSYATSTSVKEGKDHVEAGFHPMTTVAEEGFEQDAFTAHRAADDDYVDFRSMGWLKAGLIATAEVSIQSFRRLTK